MQDENHEDSGTYTPENESMAGNGKSPLFHRRYILKWVWDGLGGGFKRFFFCSSRKLGKYGEMIEMIQFDIRIFFRWVG